MHDDQSREKENDLTVLYTSELLAAIHIYDISSTRDRNDDSCVGNRLHARDRKTHVSLAESEQHLPIDISSVVVVISSEKSSGDVDESVQRPQSSDLRKVERPHTHQKICLISKFQPKFVNRTAFPSNPIPRPAGLAIVISKPDISDQRNGPARSLFSLSETTCNIDSSDLINPGKKRCCSRRSVADSVRGSARTVTLQNRTSRSSAKVGHWSSRFLHVIKSLKKE